MNVLFVEGFAKGLMLSHSDRSQFAPDVVSGVAVINGVEMGSGSVPEKTDDLIKFGRSEDNEEK